MNLTSEQLSILDHTLHRAAGCRYCGGGKAMDELVSLGLMRLLGSVAWCPDPYFTITSAGREAFAAWKASQPVPPAPKRLTRSQERYRDYLRSSYSGSFREWLGIRPKRRVFAC